MNSHIFTKQTYQVKSQVADLLTEIIVDAVLAIKKEGEPLDLHMVEVNYDAIFVQILSLSYRTTYNCNDFFYLTYHGNLKSFMN